MIFGEYFFFYNYYKLLNLSVNVKNSIEKSSSIKFLPWIYIAIYFQSNIQICRIYISGLKLFIYSERKRQKGRGEELYVLKHKFHVKYINLSNKHAILYPSPYNIPPNHTLFKTI